MDVRRYYVTGGKMKKTTVLFLAVFMAVPVLYGQVPVAISGTIEWDSREINVLVSLDLKVAGIRLPVGRLQAEQTLYAEYGRLLRPFLMTLPVDSAATIGDLINRGEFSLPQLEAIIQSVRSVPPVLSADMTSLQSWYTIDMNTINAAFIRHRYAGDIMRSLMPVPSAPHTGIVIIASNPMPVHGRNSTALPVPTLFPKIWDTNMNLVYERNIMDPQRATTRPLVNYIAPERIFRDTPSGMDESLLQLVGQNPLRIIARGVFGIRPTDIIIDRDDALRIISSEENRRLLREGIVAIVLDKSVLQATFP
jgi:hypothetical protein